MKVHLIREELKFRHPPRIETVCGRVGFATQVSGEYDTPSCDRIEATHNAADVTCGACARVAG